MHMNVRYTNPSAWSVIDADSQTIGFQRCVYDIRNSFNSQKEGGGSFTVELWQAGSVFFGDHDGMTGCEGLDIEKGDRLVVFKHLI